MLHPKTYMLHRRERLPIPSHLCSLLHNYRLPTLMHSLPSTTTHKNPLVMLTLLCTAPSTILTLPLAPSPPLTLPTILPLSLPPPLLPATLPKTPLSTLNPFHASNSRSRRSAFSLSSRKSRSALRAASWFFESSDCNSSIVVSSRWIFSRELAISVSKRVLVLSRRSICAWRSRTVRSMLRAERAVRAVFVVASSSCFSSY